MHFLKIMRLVDEKLADIVLVKHVTGELGLPVSVIFHLEPLVFSF